MRRAVAAIVALLVLVTFCAVSAYLFTGSMAELGAAEVPPIRALRILTTAQSLYRESPDRGAGRYGTLAQLRDAKLLDATLGTGTKRGYIFEVHPSSKSSDLWCALARPLKVEGGSTRAYFVNQTGVVHYTIVEKPEDLTALTISPDTAAVPTGWLPLGR